MLDGIPKPTERSSIALTGRFGGRGDRQMARGPKRRVPSAVLKPELKRFYTTQDVADLFQTSRRTVQFWIREGKLKAVRIGREWRVNPLHCGSLRRGVELVADTTVDPAPHPFPKPLVPAWARYKPRQNIIYLRGE